MATDSRLTLLDFAKSENPDGKQAQVYEVLNQTNDMVADAVAKPSNAPLGNRVTWRSSLPTVGTVKINQGAKKSKGKTEQRNDAIAFIAARSEVDKKHLKVLGAANFEAKRRTELNAWIEAFGQKLANLFLYGSVASDETAFDGLQPRMSALQTAYPTNNSAVWGYGGTANRTSVYIVDWGEGGAQLIFPPESIAGLDVQDLGELPVNDRDSNPFQAFVMELLWTVGLTVEDPRHIARVPNIDINDVNLHAPVAGNLIETLIDVMSYMPPPAGRRRVLYMHPRLLAGFRKIAINKSNEALHMGEWMNMPTPMFYGFPIRQSLQISLAESAVA